MTPSDTLTDTPDCDAWSDWVLQNRHGNDPVLQQAFQTRVAEYADKVIDACHLTPGMTLADIGCGDGVLAFRALDRIGAGLHAVLADISAPLLRHAQRTAVANGSVDQCTFLHASATDLGAIADASVDAVTTRAVLAYVADKPAALREFYRILKPGGVISVCEPLMQDNALDTVMLRKMAEERGAQPGHEILSLLHRWKSAQFPDTLAKLMASPLSNYSERDLFGFFQDSGFAQIHLEFHMQAQRVEGRPWNAFLQASPHPWAPTHGAFLRGHFSEAEQQVMESLVRPYVEAGGQGAIDRVVYVRATKPAHDRHSAPT